MTAVWYAIYACVKVKIAWTICAVRCARICVISKVTRRGSVWCTPWCGWIWPGPRWAVFLNTRVPRGGPEKRPPRIATWWKNRAITYRKKHISRGCVKNCLWPPMAVFHWHGLWKRLMTFLIAWPIWKTRWKKEYSASRSCISIFMMPGESMKKVLCLRRSSRMPGINRVQIRWAAVPKISSLCICE